MQFYAQLHQNNRYRGGRCQLQGAHGGQRFWGCIWAFKRTNSWEGCNCLNNSIVKSHWAEIVQLTSCFSWLFRLQQPVWRTVLVHQTIVGPTRNAKATFWGAKMLSRSKRCNFRLLLLNSVLPRTMVHLPDCVGHINLGSTDPADADGSALWQPLIDLFLPSASVGKTV